MGMPMAWQKSTATISCWKNDLHAEHTQAEGLSVTQRWLSACLNWATLQCAPSQRSTLSNLLAFSFSWAILHSTPLTICWLSPVSLSLINGQDGIQCMLLFCDRLVRRGLHVLRLRSETRIRDRISKQYSLTGPLILQISHGIP